MYAAVRIYDTVLWVNGHSSCSGLMHAVSDLVKYVLLAIGSFVLKLSYAAAP
jgi:hypothetical protein